MSDSNGIGQFMADLIETVVFKPLAWIIDFITSVIADVVEERIDAAKRYLAGGGKSESQQTKTPTKKP